MSGSTSTDERPGPDRAPDEQPEGAGRIRQAVMAQPERLDGLLSFLSRLGRFGLVAGMPPLLSPLNPVE